MVCVKLVSLLFSAILYKIDVLIRWKTDESLFYFTIKDFFIKKYSARMEYHPKAEYFVPIASGIEAYALFQLYTLRLKNVCWPSNLTIFAIEKACALMVMTY